MSQLITVNQFSKPSFKDYRKNNSAVAVPDKGFTKQLKMLDEDLEVVWDWGSELWEIWHVGISGDPYHVMTVKTKDKSYRELGADILLKLQENIFYRENWTAEQLCNYFEEMDSQVERRKKKDFTNQVEAYTLDNFNYMRNVVQISVPRTLPIGRIVHAES